MIGQVLISPVSSNLSVVNKNRYSTVCPISDSFLASPAKRGQKLYFVNTLAQLENVDFTKLHAILN